MSIAQKDLPTTYTQRKQKHIFAEARTTFQFVKVKVAIGEMVLDSPAGASCLITYHQALNFVCCNADPKNVSL